ncbi:MAG: PIN domain-containing protein [Vicinamibacterales bacterium]
MSPIALLDACVLYPMVLCDSLVRLAQYRLYRARWTPHIMEEVVRNIARRRPDLSEERLQRRARRMNVALPDAEITGYDALIPAFAAFGTDAHVVAAALAGRVDAIVTSNVRDFPVEILNPLGIAIHSPDEFLCGFLEDSSPVIRRAVQEQASALKNPPMSETDVIRALQPFAPNFANAAFELFVGRDPFESEVN